MNPAIIYFVIMTINHGYSPAWHVTETSSWDECFKMVQEAKIEVGPGDENEVSVAAFCTPTLPVKIRPEVK